MTLKELLKSLGLDDDIITKVLDGMKTNKIFTASEENLDIRYGKLKTDHDALVTKDKESQTLIKQLQDATKGQESIQQKITDYESKVTQLEAALTQAKTESALKIALLGAGAKPDDIDYLLFKCSNTGDWKPELDHKGNLKGIDDKLKGLKVQFPNQFNTTGEDGKAGKVIEPNPLPKGKNDKTVTREQFLQMGYNDRLKLKKENPELYHNLTSN